MEINTNRVQEKALLNIFTDILFFMYYIDFMGGGFLTFIALLKNY